VGLYYTGNTINVMTLAGLSRAIGPFVESPIICLENTHRHLGLGNSPPKAFGGLFAGLVTTLFIVPALDSLLVHDGKQGPAENLEESLA
jgi:hypothetical protein